MTSALITFFVGIAVGFLCGVYWMFRRQHRPGPGELPQPSASRIAEIARDDTGDPMAAVDRRMAHGAYEDAAEIVAAQIADYPSDVRLKAKLLEIYFVWGSEEKFLAAFRDHEDEFRHSRYWTQVSAMGAQICPNEPAFGDR